MTTAINGAPGNEPSAGGQVIVERGTYGSPTKPLIGLFGDRPNAVAREDVHGPPGQPRPLIYVAGTDSDPVALPVDIGQTLTDVDIVDPHGDPGQAAVVVDHGAVGRVNVVSNGSACAAHDDAVIVNATCLTRGVDSYALDEADYDCEYSPPARVDPMVLLNDDFVAVGPGSVGAYLSTYNYLGTPTCGIDVKGGNNIIKGADRDLVALARSSQTSLTFACQWCDFSTYLTDGYPGSHLEVYPPAITADPELADPAAGNLHETSASPTIDRGDSAPDDGHDPLLTQDLLGEDVDGQPRWVPNNTFMFYDIGADEYMVAPTAVAGAVSGVTTTSATVSAAVLTGHETTAASVAYGTTPSLGHWLAPLPILYGALGGWTAAQSVSATLSGLQPATTYYWRVSVSNVVGTTLTSEQAFTTAGSAPAGSGPAGSGPAGSGPRGGDPSGSGPRVAHQALRVGGERLVLTEPARGVCQSRMTALPVSLRQQATASNRREPRLTFKRALFYLDDGIRHRRIVMVSGRRRTAITAAANAEARRLPVQERISLAPLAVGQHTLTVKVTFGETVVKHRHRRVISLVRALRARITVC